MILDELCPWCLLSIEDDGDYPPETMHGYFMHPACYDTFFISPGGIPERAAKRNWWPTVAPRDKMADMDDVAFIDALVTDDELWESWLSEAAQRAGVDDVDELRGNEDLRTLAVIIGRPIANLQACKILAFLVIHAGFGITGRDDVPYNPL